MKKATKEKEEVKVYQGSVVFYNPGRGFGFIKREDKEKDIFFHHTSLEDSNHYPQQADIVSFQVAPGRDNREMAVNVRKIEIEDQLDLPLEEEKEGEEELEEEK